MLDLERFRAGGEIRALGTADELDNYIYLVAGCVGEFWTRVCVRRVKGFSARSLDEMRELGVAYGKGLQLVNILRDVRDDLRNGRCYLPKEELEPLGVKLVRMPERGQAVQPVVDHWLARAEQGISAGIEYACALRSWRLRLATVLPALIGARTLALLREAGPEVWQRRVKVTRPEVRGVLVKMLLTGASPASIRRTFAKLST